MEKKEQFKEFVKKNPILVRYVKNNEMSWQKFYEIYDIYGEDENAWKDYTSAEKVAATAATAASGFALADAVNWIKNINLDRKIVV